MKFYASAVIASLMLWLAFTRGAAAQDFIDPELAELDPNGIRWFDVTLLGLEGKAWEDAEAPFDRLPVDAKDLVPGDVWTLSRHSAGICVRFLTDSWKILARWAVNPCYMGHMTDTGVAGLDLYRRMPDGKWRFYGMGRPARNSSNTFTGMLTAFGENPAQREFMLYLPLYSVTRAVELGIPKGFSLAKAPARPPDKAKPLVFFGSSITQGGCASRPGMAYPAIIGRRLDRPVVNLGFSGCGKAEPEMAPLVSEIDACAYVLECLPNMGPDQVTERMPNFIRTLAQAHPDTPILLLQEPCAAGKKNVKNDALNAACQALLSEGFKNILCPAALNAYAEDGFGTVDGCHPTDLGFMLQADTLCSLLENLLGVQPGDASGDLQNGPKD